MNSKKPHIETRVTLKAEVLKGDPKISKIIEASISDTKPIYYICMVSEELKWGIKEKQYFTVNLGKV